MNRETTGNLVRGYLMLETWKMHNNEIHTALFVNLRLLDMQQVRLTQKIFRKYRFVVVQW